MPRKYIRKTNRAFADPMVMLKCAKLIKNDRKTARSVAKEHGLNYRSLLRFCSKPNINELINGDNKDAYICGYKKKSQIFTDPEEEIMIESLLKSYNVPCDFSQKKIRQFAYEFAKTKSKKIPPSWENNKQAGPDWFIYFMKRHKEFASQRNFILVRDGAIKNDNSVKSNFEIEYMDLTFPMIDPLQDAFDESQDIKSEGSDDREKEFSNDEKTEFSPESLIVVKTEMDNSFLSDELDSSQNSNSTDVPFKISTIISENLYEKEESTMNDLHSIQLPSSWSITELPDGEIYRFCLSSIVLTNKDNNVCPVIEKCIFIDAKRQLTFKARNITLDNEKLQLPKMLDNLEQLPTILSNFQNLYTCNGLNNMESFLLQELPVIKDCLQTWRHTQCSLLLLNNERCEFCSQLFQTIQEKLAKVMDPKFFS